jgi:integrase
MGKLFKRRGSAYWWARWHDAQGQLHRASTRTSDRRVAQVWLAVRETQAIKEQAGLVPRSVTLADAVGEYLDAHPPPIWSEKWHKTAAYWWRARIIPGLGGPDRPVAGIDRARAGELVAMLLRSVQPPTCNRICAVASGFFKWAVAQRYAQENPFARHTRFAEVKRKPPPLTDADLDRFVAAIPNPMIHRAAIVALDTGLRLSEVRRIRLADVHGRELHVQSSYERGLTKNTRERWVLLTARAKAAIEEQGIGVFASLPINLRKSLHRAQLVAGLERFRWHDLRHYALTRAANAGTQAHHLRGMAGWSGDESGRYIHPEAEGMRAFVEHVDCATSVSQGRPEAEKCGTIPTPTGEEPGTVH